MTEDNVPHLEIQIEHGNYKAIVRANSWLEVLTQARVADMQMRVAELTCREVSYDFAENRWYLEIPKEIEPIRNRIACALLLSFPVRITRQALEVLSSVNMASLRNYMTKPDLEVQPNIDETEEGILLNEQGYKWAMAVLESLGNNNENEEEIEDDE